MPRLLHRWIVFHTHKGSLFNWHSPSALCSTDLKKKEKKKVRKTNGNDSTTWTHPFWQLHTFPIVSINTQKLFQEESLIVIVVCVEHGATVEFVWSERAALTPEVTSKCVQRSDILHSGYCKVAKFIQTRGWTPDHHDHNVSNVHDCFVIYRPVV